MNKQTEALEMAIEALETCITYNPYEQGFNTELVETALESGKEVLKNLEKDPPISRNEQPAQEPVADYVSIDGLKYPSMVEVMAIHNERGEQTEDNCDCINAFLPQGTKLYTHPAPSWQGLSDDEMMKIIEACEDKCGRHLIGGFMIARAIEQALKEKNT